MAFMSAGRGMRRCFGRAWGGSFGVGFYFFRYAPRRVHCPTCGIHREKMPWVKGKHHLTEAYAWFLARWAKRLSWQEVASAFHTTWGHVFSSVEMAVDWGRKHRDLSGIEAIGVDEIQWQRGHRYLTLVYRIYYGDSLLNNSIYRCDRFSWVHAFEVLVPCRSVSPAFQSIVRCPMVGPLFLIAEGS